MKANKVPEKIYISDTELNDAEHCVIWFKSQQNKKDIEYICTDAFIEKAISYIQQHWIWSTKMIEDFKNYIKGK